MSGEGGTPREGGGDEKLSLVAGLGSIAENIANRLSNQNYIFAILLIAVVGGLVGGLATGSPQLAVAIVAAGLMALLFGLLSQGRRPRGWPPIYTFILMLCYVIVVLALIGFMYFSFVREPDMALAEEATWRELYQPKYDRLNEGVRVALFQADLTDEQGKPKPDSAGKVLPLIAEFVAASPDRRFDVIQLTDVLESFERCRQDECRNAAINVRFDARIFEFWANFRCVVAAISSSPGYDDGMASLVKVRFEGLPQVRKTGPIKDSLAGCPATVPSDLAGLAATDCTVRPAQKAGWHDVLRGRQRIDV